MADTLHAVARQCDDQLTRAQLERLVDVNLLSVKEDVGQIPLHYAAVFGNVLFLQLAHEKVGKRVEWFNWPDNNMRVPLHLAIWNGHVACVQFLLDIKVELDAQDKGGYSPLYFAVYRQNVPLVKLMLSVGSNLGITSYSNESMLTPLHQACILGNREIVELMLGSEDGRQVPEQVARLVEQAKPPKKCPPDYATHRSMLFLNQRDANSYTPLICAIRNRRLEVVQLLLRLGADRTLPDKHLDTPLHLTVNANLPAYAEALLTLGPGGQPLPAEERQKLLSAANKNKCTPLDIAHANDNTEIEKLLCDGQPASSAAEEVEEDHNCPICTQLLFRPVLLACKKHRLCLYCATCSVKPATGGLCPYRCAPTNLGPLQVDTAFDDGLREKYGSLCQRREAAFLKQRANANLQEYMRHTSTTGLAFNESNTCEIDAGGVPLKVTLLRKELYVYNILMKTLPEETAKRVAVLNFILEANCLGGQVCSGNICMFTSGEVVMAMSTQLALAKNTALRETVTVFTKCVTGIRDTLDAIMRGNDHRSINVVSESPAPTLVSELVGNMDKAKLMVETFRQKLEKKDAEVFHFDGNKTWYMKNNRLSLSITYEVRSDTLYMYSPIWNGLPKRDEVKSRLYEQLLRLNLFFTDLPGGGVGIDIHGDFILIHCIVPVGSVPHTALADCMQLFMSQVERCIQCANQNINQFATLYRAKRGTEVDEKLKQSLNISHFCAKADGGMQAAIADRLLDAVLRWNSMNSTTALRLAIVVSPATDRADVVFAHNVLHRLGFNVIAFSGPEATLANVLHAMNFGWVLAKQKRVLSFHFHFSGHGLEHALDDRDYVRSLQLHGSEVLPLCLLRFYAERLAESDVNSCQLVVDAAFAAHDGEGALIAPRPHTFPWAELYRPRPWTALWADLSQRVWVLEAGPVASAEATKTPGIDIGTLTKALYVRLTAPATSNPQQLRLALRDVDVGLAGKDTKDTTLASLKEEHGNFLATDGVEVHKRSKVYDNKIIGGFAFKCTCERIFYALRGMLFHRLDPASADVFCPEQSPVFVCHKHKLELKPFTDERPLADEIMDDTFRTAPYAGGAKTLRLHAGQLQGVYEGQEFTLLHSESLEPLTPAVVVSVAGSYSEVVPTSTAGLKTGASYTAVDAWHAAVPPRRRDERLRVWHGSQHQPPNQHVPVLASRQWLTDIPAVRPVDAASRSAMVWATVYADDEPGLPDSHAPVDLLAQARELDPAAQEVLHRLCRRREQHSGPTDDLEQDARMGFPVTRSIARQLGPYAALQRFTDELAPAEVRWLCDVFTGQVKYEPAQLSDGFSYEQLPLRSWLRHMHTSPSTGALLDGTQVVPSLEIRGIVQGKFPFLPKLTLEEVQESGSMERPEASTEDRRNLASWLQSTPARSPSSRGPPPPEKPAIVQRLEQCETEYLLTPYERCRLRALYLQECQRAPAQQRPSLPLQPVGTEMQDYLRECVEQLPIWQDEWAGLEYGAMLQQLSLEKVEDAWLARMKLLCETQKAWFRALQASARPEAVALQLAAMEAQIAEASERNLFRGTAMARMGTSVSSTPESEAVAAIPPYKLYFSAVDGMKTGSPAEILPLIVTDFRIELAKQRQQEALASYRSLRESVMATLAGLPAAGKESVATWFAQQLKLTLPQASSASDALIAKLQALEDESKKDNVTRQVSRLGTLCCQMWYALQALDVSGLTANASSAVMTSELAQCKASIRVLKSLLLWSKTQENTLTLLATQNPISEQPSNGNTFVLSEPLTDLYAAKATVQRLARYLRKLRIVHPPKGCLRRLQPIKVRVKHERQEQVIQEYELTTAVHHANMKQPVTAGDIVRLVPTIAGTGGETLHCHMYLYDFLPSLGVTMLDRAPITLQTAENNKFPGTGGVIEWENDYLSWKDAAEETVSLEHFKLFFSTHDMAPLQLQKHQHDDSVRPPSEDTEFCVFTVSFGVEKAPTSGN